MKEVARLYYVLLDAWNALAFAKMPLNWLQALQISPLALAQPPQMLLAQLLELQMALEQQHPP